MTAVFAWAAVVLAGAGALFTFVLALQRVQISRRERTARVAEARVRSLGLALVHGEAVAADDLLREEAEALARLLARYSRWLSGGALGHIGEFFERSGAVEATVERLTDRRPWARATAAFSLGDMASPTAVPALLAALRDPHRDVRAAAARSLGRLGAADAVEPLVYALVDRELPRAVAGAALLAIGPEALPELRALEARAEAEVRVATVELVGLLGDADEAPLLRRRLRDSSAEVRAKAARALGRLAAEGAAADLRALLGDRVPFVRTSAARALGAIGDRLALDALLRQATTDTFEPARAAAWAIAQIDAQTAAARGSDPGAGPHLLEAADLVRIDAG